MYQIALVGIRTERKGLAKGGNGSPIINKGTGKGMIVIRLGKKATMMTLKLMMTSMMSAFWSAMMTSLMPWSTMLKI